jgi:Rps23 Pro-64 3,4-dihydroxylase Tpa1-like proline 4-hydroxylase
MAKWILGVRLIHPQTKKHRRINALLYLNSDWKQEYNGCLELWNKYDEIVNQATFHDKYPNTHFVLAGWVLFLPHHLCQRCS